MGELNLEFFKKRPSEELFDQACELLREINPDLLVELEPIVQDDDLRWI